MSVNATGDWKFVTFRNRIDTPYGPMDGAFGTAMHVTGDVSGGIALLTATSNKPADWAGRLLIIDHITAIVDGGGAPDIEYYFSLGLISNIAYSGQLLPTAPVVRASLRGLDAIRGSVLWPGMPATQAAIQFILEFKTNTNGADYYAGFEGYYRAIAPGAVPASVSSSRGGGGGGGGQVSVQ